MYKKRGSSGKIEASNDTSSRPASGSRLTSESASVTSAPPHPPAPPSPAVLTKQSSSSSQPKPSAAPPPVPGISSLPGPPPDTKVSENVVSPPPPPPLPPPSAPPVPPPSTKSTTAGPPPPLPPPPPRPKGNLQSSNSQPEPSPKRYEGEAGSRSYVKSEDLLLAKRNLRKVNRKDVYEPTTMEKADLFRNDVGIIQDQAEFLPFHIAKHNMVNQNLTTDLACLNLSGADMVTDALFYVLRFSNTYFRMLKKLICTGCHHLSDNAMIWVAEMCPELLGLELEGCNKVTEKGLTAIVRRCTQLHSLSIVGTGVARIPIDIGKSKVVSGNIRAQGSPVISSGFSFVTRKAEKLQQQVKRKTAAKALDKFTGNVKDFEVFKVVVLRDESVAATLMDIMGKKASASSAPPFSVTKFWQPAKTVEEQSNDGYTVLEVAAQSTLHDTVVTPGSIVVLTYQLLDGNSTAVGNRLAATVGMVLAKDPDVVILILGLPSGQQTAGQGKAVQDAMMTRLNTWKSAIHSILINMMDKSWKVEMLDFSGQQSLAAGGAVFETLGKLTAEDSSQIIHMSAEEGKVEEVFAEGLRKCAEAVKIQVPWIHDPVDHTCFYLRDIIPVKTLHTQHDIYNNMSVDLRLQFHERQPYPHMGKILELMQNMGCALYMPGSKDSICVTDLPAYGQLLSSFLSTKAPRSGHIPCLGEADVSYWDKATIEDFIKKENNDLEVDLFIKTITKQGLVLPVRWKQDKQQVNCEARKTAMQTAYLLASDLPENQPSLEQLYPPQIPSDMVHGELFYTVLPGLPASVLISVMRHIMKVFKPQLVWKTGLLLQQGPANIFVQLWYNQSDGSAKFLPPTHLVETPVLVVSGRMPVFAGTGPPVKIKSSTCLFGFLQTVQTICDYVFLKHKLFTAITVPCELCSESDLKKALNRMNCFHFAYYQTLSSEQRNISCKIHKLRTNMTEICGPQYRSIVPYHNYPYQHSANEWRDQLFEQKHYRPADPIVPCYLCEEGTDLLCSNCHICLTCVKKLAKFETLVKPGFIRSAMIESAEEADGSDLSPAKVRFRGSMISMKKDQTMYLTEPMSPVYFNHLSVTIYRGYDYILLGLLVNGKTIMFKGLSGCFFDEDGKDHSNVSYKCREGYGLDIRLAFSEVPGKSIVLVYLNGLKILQHEIEGWEMRVGIKKKVAGSCLIKAPGVRQVWQLNKERKPALGNVVEYVTSDPSKVAKAIFTEAPQLQKFAALASDGTKILTSMDVNIRPRGYAELKEKELVLDLELTAPPQTVKIPMSLWKFSQHQLHDCVQDLVKSIQDPEDLVYSCTNILSPSITFAAMERKRAMVEEALFQNGNVDYTDTAVMLLPQGLTAADFKAVPSHMVMHHLDAHPLCYVRGDTNSVMTVLPTYNLPRQIECFRLVHMVNNPGFPLPPEDETLIPLLWAWPYMLLHLQKEGLSKYDQLLQGTLDFSSLSNEEIWQGLKEILKKIIFLLYIRMEEETIEYYFAKHATVNRACAALRKEVHRHVKQGPEKYDLQCMSMAFSEHQLHVCPGHANTWQANKEITEIPQVILTAYPQFIYSLLLASNNLSELPKRMFTVLPNLKDLELASNQLTMLPDEIGLCPHMETLSVLKNKISSLPDSLANCKKLSRLEISKNHFTKFPEVILKLTSLRRLYAQNLQLTKLPDNIGDLIQLRKLYLNGNCFTSLPASVGKLQHLQDLSLNGVPWCKARQNQLLSKKHFEDLLDSENLTRWMDKNNKDKNSLFQQFDEDANGTLDQKEIGKVNATIFVLFPRFGYMDPEPPDDDTPSGFPMEILQLENLEYLSLQYQGLVAVPPEIGQLKKVHTINVSHNPNLLSVSAEAANLPLKRLEMDECPLLKTPPKEIRAKGFQSSYAFLKRLISGSVDCKRTKLMMVGLGGAGKTSLVKALMTDTNKANMEIGEEITDGIDICPWTVDTADGSLTFSVWDFAGQTVYYNTHQFFLSDRAVYFLLWNIRLGHEHAGLDFWLSSISVHAPKAPIFVVGTHVDQVSKVELPMREMKQRYSQIADFHFVSSFSGQGIQELREQLIDVTLQQQYMGEKIPGVWLGFEESLKKITERSVIPYTELEKIANQSGIFEKSEVVQAVQFLHELGSLQHFTNDFLKDQVVINPQWIVDVMACVVSVKGSAIKDGRLRHEDICLVWKDYPESLHPWLLRLTEEYDLTFPLKEEQINLVPCLLTEKEPEFEWPEVEKGSGMRETKMIYKFDYLPAGLFNRGQVRLHEFSDSSLTWKRGSYLRKNGHLCLVRQTRDSELVVRAQGPRPENILFLVHEVYEGLILESFQGVTYDYLIPCPECLRLFLKGPHMFAASIIRRAVELKAPFLQCLKYFHTISIVELQAGMPPEASTDYDLHLVQAVRGLKELQRDLAADIFVSFCKKDEKGDKPGAITPAKVLTDLEQLGYKSWVASSDSAYSMDEMAKALMDAPLFVAFMTNLYVTDEGCCNLFKYARLTLRKPILLVTIGSGFEWRQSKLGILLSDEVYINMQQQDRYVPKFEELKTALTDRLKKKTDEENAKEFPPCFISYCWQNSARAVAKGSRTVEGASGFGDPRDIKDYLDKKGINCWIDIERVGVHGLFEDIGEGLVNAKVVLVCVSDEYAASSNCVVEFRFVANTLKLPVVLAVVGSGSKWRATEVGVLSQNYPVVSFQESQTPAVYDRLVQLIQPYLNTNPDSAARAAEKAKTASKDQKSHSFQELCELAQRKFLRQLILYAEVQDMLPYPRLFLVDFVKMEDDADEKASTAVGDSTGEAKEGTDNKKFMSAADFHHCRFIVNILCEHEEGWHIPGESIAMPPEFGTAIEEYAPFLSRLSAIAKYSKKLVMNCMTQYLGKHFLQWLEKSPQIAEVSDFQQSYLKLRQTVAEADENRVMGNLARCHLPNGRMVWLCEKHRQSNRVTVLSDTDTVSSTHHVTESIGVDYFLQALREMPPPDTNRPDTRCESRASMPSIPEDSASSQPTATATSSKVTDTSSAGSSAAPPPVSKRTSKSKMKPVAQSDTEPKPPLQRQQSQLNFNRTKSRACVVM